MNGWMIRTCVVGMISTNCYLVYRDEAGTGPEETRPGVIIDPGDNAAYVEHQCLQLRIQPQAILLTHGHFDHLLRRESCGNIFRFLFTRERRKWECCGTRI